MTQRPILDPPHNQRHILLHLCCAPCSGDIIETLLTSHIECTLLFYNPNIHPRREYEIRKTECQHFAEKHHIPFVDADYDTNTWFTRVAGMEREPERGRRCTTCFDIRLEHTALYAHTHHFTVFATSLGISRWKDIEQVNHSGQRAAARYPNLHYWPYNWRKHGGSQRTIDIAKREHFYQQEYCGCIYSLRDRNHCRQQNGRKTISTSVQYPQDNTTPPLTKKET